PDPAVRVHEAGAVLSLRLRPGNVRLAGTPLEGVADRGPAGGGDGPGVGAEVRHVQVHRPGQGPEVPGQLPGVEPARGRADHGVAGGHAPVHARVRVQLLL